MEEGVGPPPRADCDRSWVNMDYDQHRKGLPFTHKNGDFGSLKSRIDVHGFSFDTKSYPVWS